MPVSDELCALGPADLAGGEARIQAGKKKIGRIVVKDQSR
jgi:hypothetical protein